MVVQALDGAVSPLPVDRLELGMNVWHRRARLSEKAASSKHP